MDNLAPALVCLWEIVSWKTYARKCVPITIDILAHLFELNKRKHTENKRSFRTPCSGSPVAISTQFSKRQLKIKLYTAAIFNVDVDFTDSKNL